MAPAIVLIAFRQGGGEGGDLQPLIAHFEREALLAGEGAVRAGPGVEAGMGEARGGGGEADIGARREGAEEGLLGGLGHAAGRGEAELKAAVAEADDCGFAAFCAEGWG